MIIAGLYPPALLGGNERQEEGQGDRHGRVRRRGQL